MLTLPLRSVSRFVSRSLEIGGTRTPRALTITTPPFSEGLSLVGSRAFAIACAANPAAAMRAAKVAHGFIEIDTANLVAVTVEVDGAAATLYRAPDGSGRW